MNGAEIPQQIPLHQLLGQHFQPSAMTWTWMKVQAPNGTQHLLVVDEVVGRRGYLFSEEDLGEFIRTAQTQLTGLTLPRPGEVPL